MANSNMVVAIYDTHAQAEDAVRKLAQAGLDMKTISIVGKDYHTEEQPVGFFNAGARAKYFGKLGAFWGSLAGILFGSALMFIPVLGHIIILGPLAAAVVSALEGAAVGGGVSAVAGALSSLGVPKDSVIRYEAALKADKFVVAVHNVAPNVEQRARDVLAAAGSNEVQSHPAP